MKETEALALLKKYKAGGCSEEERAMLESWYLEWNGEWMDQDLAVDDQHFSEAGLMDLREEMWAVMPKPVSKVKRLWPRITVAASIVIAIGAGIYFFNVSRYFEGSAATRDLLANDIVPGTNKATLTLSNGKLLQLSNAKAGVVVGADFIRYASGTQFSGPVKVASLSAGGLLKVSTPRGGTYQVVLPDGSKVWLNAASSLTFPSTFALSVKNERRVELIGEAYFEVEKDKQHPFIVSTKRQEVLVLGTHFNINSYQDEESVKTTLLEGSVHVSSLQESNGVVLKPNQQAILAGSNQLTVKEMDGETAIDWKNGDFIFKGERLESAMRKVARWYNVEVAYASNAPKDVVLIGSVSRSRNILAVLELLERTGTVKLKAEGRKITIL